MKNLFLTFLLLLSSVQTHATILVLNPDGTQTTITTLAVASTLTDAAGKTIVVTSPQTLTSDILWPADRTLEFRTGGYIIPNGHVIYGRSVWKPQEFNARADGTNDDTSAIQSAVNFVSANTVITPDWPQPSWSKQGGKVYFPAGNYRITGTITVESPLVNLEGEDRSSTRIYADSSLHRTWPALKIWTPDAKIGFGQIRLNSVKHLTFWTKNDGNNRDTAIQVDFAEYASFEDIYIAAFGVSGLDFRTLFESSIRDVYIFSVGGYQNTSNSDNTQGVINIFGSDRSGVVPNPSNNLKFYDITLSGCYGKQINIVGGNTTTLVNPNYSLSFKGLRHESSLSEAGAVSNKNHVFINNAIDVIFDDFLFSLHPLAAHSPDFLKTVYNQNTRNINLLNGAFYYSAANVSSPVALSSIVNSSTDLSLTNVQFVDVFGVLPYPLINMTAATANLNLSHVQFVTPHIKITATLSRYLGSKVNGDITTYKNWVSPTPYKVWFENGLLRMYTDNGVLFDNLIVGDQLINHPPASGGYQGKVVTSAGVYTLPWSKYGNGGAFTAGVGLYILPTTSNGHVYIATTGGTTSSTEPTWPTSTGSTVKDGEVVWTEAGSAIIIKDYGAIL